MHWWSEKRKIKYKTKTGTKSRKERQQFNPIFIMCFIIQKKQGTGKERELQDRLLQCVVKKRGKRGREEGKKGRETMNLSYLLTREI